ncbi:hypothetical protein, partial [Streptomyces scabiei]|uniref:hypothetical protein n=2 Tax=Streptomyces scabiei TaxID=1930 RepID=UPI001F2F513D
MRPAPVRAASRRARGAFPCAGQCLAQHLQFCGATDEHGTDGPGLHIAEHRTTADRSGTDYPQAPAGRRRLALRTPGRRLA